jgi:hypothetical protein
MEHVPAVIAAFPISGSPQALLLKEPSSTPSLLKPKNDVDADVNVDVDVDVVISIE